MTEPLPDHGPYTKESVSQAYGGALLRIANEQGVLSEVASQVDELLDMLKDANLRQLLFSPSLTTTQRAGVIERLFKGRLNDELYRFLHVVNQKNRSGLLVSMLQAFTQLLTQQRGIIEVDLYAPQRLDKPQLQNVIESISNALKSEIVVHQYPDPSLIGGIKLRIGDKVIDGSVAAQLKLIKQKLVDVGRLQARQQMAQEAAGDLTAESGD